MRTYCFLLLILVSYANLAIGQNSLPSTGNVGINTTSPSTPLHVVGGPTMTAGWNKTSTLHAIYPVQVFNSNNSKWAGIGYDFSTAMRFWVNAPTDDLPGTGICGMTIMNNGNIGFGTQNPQTLLHINSQSSSPLMISRSGSNTYGFEIGGSTFGLFDYTHSKYKWRVEGENLLLNPVSGKVGIGNVSPKTLMHLHEDGERDTYLHLTNQSTGAQSADGLEISSNNDRGANLWNYENGYLRFATNNTEQMRVTNDGKIGVGTQTPSEKFTVNGNVKAKKVIVSQSGWPDYVFDPAYKLKPLSELSAFIRKYKHLPDLPSAKEVEEAGISVGDNQALLLKKIEELTLYIIQLDESNKKLVSEVTLLKQKKQANEK